MELTYLIMTAYSDDTTFFLNDLDSIKNVLEMLDQYYIAYGLCPYLSKFEIGCIGSLKDVKLALCGLKSLDLTKEY